MSLTKNKSIRCDWCGKLTRDRSGSYTKPDGSAGRIIQPEWFRFPGGDHTADNIPTDLDICDECAENYCPACGSDRIVHQTPTVPGPFGWGGRCKSCGYNWGLTVRDEPQESEGVSDGTD